MNKNKKYSVAVVSVLVVVAAYLTYLKNQAPGDPLPQLTIATTETESPHQLYDQTSENPSAITKQPSKTDPALQELAEKLLQQYGSEVIHPHAQLKVLEKLIRYLQETFPGDWQQRLPDVLSEFFPNVAEQMLRLFEAMVGYQQWLQTDQQTLTSLSKEAQQQLLWEMRYQFFGEAANEIWADAIKNEQLARALGEINQPDNPITFQEKTERYVTALNETYGDDLNTELANNQQVIVDRFLTLNQVQADLAQMPTEDRRQSLTDLRRALNMSEDAIQRWQALDIRRDARRSIGERYVTEKAKLEEQHNGEAYQQALINLQDELFASEAETIRYEEAAGYFRFEQPQIFGVN